MKALLKKYFLYLIRWQLSTPILAVCVVWFASMGTTVATILVIIPALLLRFIGTLLLADLLTQGCQLVFFDHDALFNFAHLDFQSVALAAQGCIFGIQPLTEDEQERLRTLGKQLAQQWGPHFGPVA